jgi:hypothetical protein
MQWISSGGQVWNIVGSVDDTDAHTLMHPMAYGAMAVHPTHMQVIEVLHAITRGAPTRISKHLNSIGVALLLPAKQAEAL